MSGVVRLDFEMARHFFSERTGTRAIQYGVAGPSLIGDLRPLTACIEQVIHRQRNGFSTSWALQRIVDWLVDGADVATSSERRPAFPLRSYLRFLTPPYWAQAQTIENGAIYLNTAQHALAYPMFFKWLGARPDIKGIFFVHDLLPLDYPEFWREGYRDSFVTALGVLAKFGRGFIVTSKVVLERLSAELERQGRPSIPILQSTPPGFSNADFPEDGRNPDLATIPYFVMLGTIEPRKNHLLVLNVWRQLAEQGGPVPKLVVIGRRGWENEQVLDMLDRSPALRGHVMEVPHVSDADARALISNACALLFPSFAEGFGLSVAEALAVGTPVLTSDIPVLHETSQEKAIFLHPLDGPGWTSAILALADRSSPMSVQARARAAGFRPRTVESFLGDVEAFLARF